MSKNALVIGGAGFLGSGIVRELGAAGWNVAVMGRGNKQLSDPGIAFLRVDRTVEGALAAAVGGQTFDLVVDCAAYKAADAEGARAPRPLSREHLHELVLAISGHTSDADDFSGSHGQRHARKHGESEIVLCDERLRFQSRRLRALRRARE